MTPSWMTLTHLIMTILFIAVTVLTFKDMIIIIGMFFIVKIGTKFLLVTQKEWLMKNVEAFYSFLRIFCKATFDKLH